MARKEETSFSLAELATRVGGKVFGDAAVRVSQVATLADARSGQISFFHNPRYRQQLSGTQASAVIVSPLVAKEYPPSGQCAYVVVEQPYEAYAQIATILNPLPKPTPGTHATAQIGQTARVPASASVGPFAVVSEGVVVGERAVIGAHVVLGENVVLGEDCVLHSHVTIYEGCCLGKRVTVHAGTVIGADGFGFAPSQQGWCKIPQIAGVDIGDDVEIGANTTIDRGALTPTIVGRGCKLDNQIQIGHNCIIGEHTVIAGCVGIAGSTRIGNWCQIGGAAMILGHLEIADRCEISPGSMVMKSITNPGKYTALMPLDTHKNWLVNASQIRHLQKLVKRVEVLEKHLKTSSEQGS